MSILKVPRNLPISALLAIGIASGVAGAHWQGQTPELPGEFASDKVSDPVSKLIAEIGAGTIKLTYEPKQGYLRSILSELSISPTTQVLVFSKTSLQSSYISPSTPRAIYCNDRVYVGWIPGAPNIELISIDPALGPVFYTLANQPGPRPEVTRQTDLCFQCHFTPVAGRVPSLLARSVFVGSDGTPQLGHGSFNTTASSPMEERWGGWYVTGLHGSQRHMGNEVAAGDEKTSAIDREKGANVTRLDRYFGVDAYLTGSSDIVALMVFEQQLTIQNAMTKAGFLTRKALKDSADLISWNFKADYVAEETQGRIKNACEPLVRALLGIDEPPLTSPIAGSKDFAATFSAKSPGDKSGRRLSELDLKTRLLRYPCSPLIYSESFAGLPKEAKDQVFKRIVEILTGKDTTTASTHLNPADAKATLEILRDTLANFPPEAKEADLVGQN